MSKKVFIIPVFIPHKGCPFDCIYCNQKVISGQIEDMTVEKVCDVIESFLCYIHDGDDVEVAFYGGSFTGIPKDEQILFLEAANKYIKEGKVHKIRLSTRPDYINRHILEYLMEYNVGTIELGAQSLDTDVLCKSNRGHDIESVRIASELIHEFGLNLGIQTMIGLPGDSREKAVETAKMVIDMRPSIVRIYPTLVIKGTELEKMYLNGDYEAVSLEEAVETCAVLLDMYEEAGIKVIRLGLQTTENINEGRDVVAGPFHAAFRQLVESKRWLERVSGYIEENNLKDVDRICIYVSNENISDLVGQKRGNIGLLKEKYRYREVFVKPLAFSGREFKIEKC